MGEFGIVWMELFENSSRKTGVVCQWAGSALVSRLVVHQHSPQFIVKPKTQSPLLTGSKPGPSLDWG